MRPALLLAPTLFALACAHSPKVVAPATAEERAIGLGQLEKLAGTWEMPDEEGKPFVAAVFAVTAKGSAVREIMFPGTPHEMTNVYHLDGATLRMTHYCASGNQPHLKARAPAPGRLDFVLDHVTNLTSADDTYMGEVSLVLKDENTLEERWIHFVKGERQPETVFVLRRRQAAQ